MTEAGFLCCAVIVSQAEGNGADALSPKSKVLLEICEGTVGPQRELSQNPVCERR